MANIFEESAKRDNTKRKHVGATNTEEWATIEQNSSNAIKEFDGLKDVLWFNVDKYVRKQVNDKNGNFDGYEYYFHNSDAATKCVTIESLRELKESDKRIREFCRDLMAYSQERLIEGFYNIIEKSDDYESRMEATDDLANFWTDSRLKSGTQLDHCTLKDDKGQFYTVYKYKVSDNPSLDTLCSVWDKASGVANHLSAIKRAQAEKLEKELAEKKRQFKEKYLKELNEVRDEIDELRDEMDDMSDEDKAKAKDKLKALKQRRDELKKKLDD